MLARFTAPLFFCANNQRTFSEFYFKVPRFFLENVALPTSQFLMTNNSFQHLLHRFQRRPRESNVFDAKGMDLSSDFRAAK